MRAAFSARVITRPWTREGIRAVVIVVIVIVALIAVKAGMSPTDVVMLAVAAGFVADGRFALPQGPR